MAKTTINARQISLTGSAAAMDNLVGNGSLTDNAVFMLQQGTNPVQLIRAKDMQEYFSHIDVDTKSDNNEYTLLFIDPDVQDATTDGFTILRDSNGYNDLAYNPSTNLLRVSGSLSLMDDSVAVNFGADGDVSLTHVADTGLLLNSSRQLQFGASTTHIKQVSATNLEVEADGSIILDAPVVLFDDDAAILKFGADDEVQLTHVADTGLKLTGTSEAPTFQFRDANSKISSSTAGQLDIDAGTEIEIAAPTLDLDASTSLNVSGAAVVFTGGSYSLTGDSSTTFDVDVDGALTLDGGSITIGGDSDVAVDIDAQGLTLDASSTAALRAASSLTLSGSSLDIDASAGAADIAATAGVAISAGAASSFTTSAGALSLHGAGGINVGTTSDVAVDLDASTLTIDASDTAALYAANSLSLSGSSLDIDASSGAIDIDATGAITIDSDDTSNGVKIATDLSGVPVTIGNGTSQVTVQDNLIVKGDLTVEGDTVRMDVVNLQVEDNIIGLGISGSVEGTAGDRAIIMHIAEESNPAVFWDESGDEFAFARVTGSATESEIGLVGGGYASLHISALDADAASTIASLKVEDLTSGRVVLAGTGGEIEDDGNLTFDGSTLKVVGSISGSANVEMGGNLTVDGNSILGDQSSDTLSVLATATFTPTADFDAGLTVNDAQSIAGDGVLTVTSAGQLHVDSTGGKVQISGSGGIELESVDDNSAETDIDVDSFYYLDATDGLVKRDKMSDVFQLAKGDGVQVSNAGLFSIDPVELVVMSGSTTNVTDGNSIAIADNHDSAILQDSFEVYLNGMLLTKTGVIVDFESNTGDYSVSGTTITLVDELDDDDVLTVRYIKK